MFNKIATYRIFFSIVCFLIFTGLKIQAQNQTVEHITENDSTEIKALLEKAESKLKTDIDSSSCYTNLILSSIKDSLNKYYVQALYIKGEIYYYSNKKDSAIILFKQILNHPEKLKNRTTEILAMNYIGLSYYDLGLYGKAEKIMQKSIKKSSEYGLSFREAAAHNNLSLIYSELGLYDKSIISLSRSLKIFHKLNDTIALIKTFNNLGILYQEIKDFETAEEYYLKTLALSNKVHNTEMKAAAYVNLGNFYTELNNNEKALEYLKKAEPLLELGQNKVKIAENYIFLGNVYSNLKQYDQALKHYDSAYLIYKKTAYLDYKLQTINKIANIYIIENNFNKAYKYIKEARKLTDKNYDKSLYPELYKTISFYFEKKGDFSNALLYYKSYSEIKDSLLETKFNENVAKQKVLFENNLQQKKIKALNIENKTNRIIQKNQSDRIKYITWIIIAAVIIIISGILLTILIFRQLRIKNKLYKAINNNRKILLEKNYEIVQQNEEVKSQTEQLYQINEDLMQLKTAIDESENAVVILDKDGNFEWGNKGFDELYDTSFEEFKKKFPNILDASKNSNNYVEMSRVIKHTIANKTSGHYEFSTLNKKGEKIWVKTNIKAITDIKGEIQNIIVVDTDITDKVLTGRLLEIKNHELEKQTEEINSSLRYAKTIQNAMLPTKENMRSRNDFFLIYLPKDIVSGDFYWYLSKEDSGYVFYSVVDCTGHGVPGAFMSMIGARLLNYLVYEKNINLPSEILEQMNISIKLALKQKLSGNKDGMDISLIRTEKTIDNRTQVVFSGAKQSIFIYNKRENSIKKIRGDIKTIGGYIEDGIPFTNKKITVDKGDIIYLLSDGIIDQNDPEGKKIGTSGFQKILSEITDMPLKNQKEKIIEILNNHKKNINQRDDITILGIKIE